MVIRYHDTHMRMPDHCLWVLLHGSKQMEWGELQLGISNTGVMWGELLLIPWNKKLYPLYSSCNWVPCATNSGRKHQLSISSNRWSSGCPNVHQWDMVHLTCPALSNLYNFSVRFSNASLIMYMAVGSLCVCVYMCPPISPWWMQISHHLVIVVRLTVAPNWDRARVPSLHTRATSYTPMNVSVTKSS